MSVIVFIAGLLIGAIVGTFTMALAVAARDADDKMPDPETERPKGKWERKYSRPGVYRDLYWHCSSCAYMSSYRLTDKYYNYCPNCGADMRGAKT